MTWILLDPTGLEDTAGVLQETSTEWELVATQLSADAAPWCMPPDVAATVEHAVGAVAVQLRQLSVECLADSSTLIWRAGIAEYGENPSLSAVAEAMFGPEVIAAGLFLVGGSAADPQLEPGGGFSPIGCLDCWNGPAVLGQVSSIETTVESSGIRSGSSTYQTLYEDASGNTVVIGGQPPDPEVIVFDPPTSDPSASQPSVLTFPGLDPGVVISDAGSSIPPGGSPTLLTFPGIDTGAVIVDPGAPVPPGGNTAIISGDPLPDIRDLTLPDPFPWPDVLNNVNNLPPYFQPHTGDWATPNFSDWTF